jgi:hypothetical protein
MYAYQITAAGFRALTALAIVLAIAYTFQYGHSATLAGLLHPLLHS